MQLLSKAKAQAEHDKKAEESKTRTGRILEEESKAARSLSETKERVARETEKITTDFLAFEATIKEKKHALSTEIATLEAKRADEMRPLTALREQLDERQKNLKEAEDDLTRRENEFKQYHEECVDLATELADRKHELDERENHLTKQEMIRMEAEARLKRSADELATKWIEYHKAIHAQNTDLTKREREIEATRRGTDGLRETLEKRAAQLNEWEISLKDRYKQMEKTAKELGIL